MPAIVPTGPMPSPVTVLKSLIATVITINHLTNTSVVFHSSSSPSLSDGIATNTTSLDIGTTAIASANATQNQSSVAPLCRTATRKPISWKYPGQSKVDAVMSSLSLFSTASSQHSPSVLKQTLITASVPLVTPLEPLEPMPIIPPTDVLSNQNGSVAAPLIKGEPQVDFSLPGKQLPSSDLGQFYQKIASGDWNITDAEHMMLGALLDDDIAALIDGNVDRDSEEEEEPLEDGDETPPWDQPEEEDAQDEQQAQNSDNEELYGRQDASPKKRGIPADYNNPTRLVERPHNPTGGKPTVTQEAWTKTTVIYHWGRYTNPSLYRHISWYTHPSYTLPKEYDWRPMSKVFNSLTNNPNEPMPSTTMRSGFTLPPRALTIETMAPLASFENDYLVASRHLAMPTGPVSRADPPMAARELPMPTGPIPHPTQTVNLDSQPENSDEGVEEPPEPLRPTETTSADAPAPTFVLLSMDSIMDNFERPTRNMAVERDEVNAKDNKDKETMASGPSHGPKQVTAREEETDESEVPKLVVKPSVLTKLNMAPRGGLNAIDGTQRTIYSTPRTITQFYLEPNRACVTTQFLTLPLTTPTTWTVPCENPEDGQSGCDPDIHQTLFFTPAPSESLAGPLRSSFPEGVLVAAVPPFGSIATWQQMTLPITHTVLLTMPGRPVSGVADLPPETTWTLLPGSTTAKEAVALTQAAEAISLHSLLASPTPSIVQPRATREARHPSPVIGSGGLRIPTKRALHHHHSETPAPSVTTAHVLEGRRQSWSDPEPSDGDGWYKTLFPDVTTYISTFWDGNPRLQPNTDQLGAWTLGDRGWVTRTFTVYSKRGLPTESPESGAEASSGSGPAIQSQSGA